MLQAKSFSVEYDGQILDPELLLVETEKKYDVESSEHPSKQMQWQLWT